MTTTTTTRSSYIGAVEVEDGYAGATVTLYLVRYRGAVLAVHPIGFYVIPLECWPTSRERAALVGHAIPNARVA